LTARTSAATDAAPRSPAAARPRTLAVVRGTGLDPTAIDALQTDLADPAAVARDAGLRYVSDAAPGLRRRRRGTGWSYSTADGDTLRDPDERQRIDALAVPPAWTDVWICPDPRGHLQATGRDARGRKQYRYHPRWREVRDADKFARLPRFGLALAEVRATVDAELGRPGLSREKVLSVVVRLLDETLIRVGNAEYASTNDSYGLTTLAHEHVQIEGSELTFSFVGKGAVEHEVSLRDRRLAGLVRRCHELGGQELFAWRDPDGSVHDVGSGDVNEWLRAVTGEPVSAKDFRTWGATVIATEALAALDPPTTAAEAQAQFLGAVDLAAAQLGNTRAVCRTSYVHPIVSESHADGRLHDAWRTARPARRHRRGERTVLALLHD
jgi:DNA topoisomerase-1